MVMYGYAEDFELCLNGYSNLPANPHYVDLTVPFHTDEAEQIQYYDYGKDEVVILSEYVNLTHSGHDAEDADAMDAESNAEDAAEQEDADSEAELKVENLKQLTDNELGEKFDEFLANTPHPFPSNDATPEELVLLKELKARGIIDYKETFTKISGEKVESHNEVAVEMKEDPDSEQAPIVVDDDDDEDDDVYVCIGVGCKFVPIKDVPQHVRDMELPMVMRIVRKKSHTEAQGTEEELSLSSRTSSIRFDELPSPEVEVEDEDIIQSSEFEADDEDEEVAVSDASQMMLFDDEDVRVCYGVDCRDHVPLKDAPKHVHGTPISMIIQGKRNYKISERSSAEQEVYGGNPEYSSDEVINTELLEDDEEAQGKNNYKSGESSSNEQEVYADNPEYSSDEVIKTELVEEGEEAQDKNNCKTSESSSNEQEVHADNPEYSSDEVINTELVGHEGEAHFNVTADANFQENYDDIPSWMDEEPALGYPAWTQKKEGEDRQKKPLLIHDDQGNNVWMETNVRRLEKIPGVEYGYSDAIEVWSVFRNDAGDIVPDPVQTTGRHQKENQLEEPKVADVEVVDESVSMEEYKEIDDEIIDGRVRVVSQGISPETGLEFIEVELIDKEEVVVEEFVPETDSRDNHQQENYFSKASRDVYNAQQDYLESLDDTNQDAYKEVKKQGQQQKKVPVVDAKRENEEEYVVKDGSQFGSTGKFVDLTRVQKPKGIKEVLKYIN